VNNLATIAGESTVASAAISAPPRGFVDSSAIRRWFGKGKQATKARLAWAAALPAKQKRQARPGTRFYYSPAAVGPDGKTTVGEYLQSRPVRISEQIRRLRWKQQEKTRAAMELLARREGFAGTDTEFWAVPANDELRRKHKLGRDLWKHDKRLKQGVPLDQRFRSGRRPAPPPDPRLVAAYEDIALHANFDSLAEAWRHMRDLAENLHLPIRGPTWWRKWFKRTHPQVAVRYCKSQRKFEAENLPKIHRNYDDVAPLEWVSLDGHEMNLFVRVPTANQGWKRARPVLSGVLDVRSRMFLGWDIRECETSDGILAGIKQCVREHGCPRHYYADNGEAYKASLGHPRRLNRQIFDDPRIGAICAQTGAQRHTSIPYQAWAKMIESIWRRPIEGFERYCWSWIGNSPANRPDNRHKEIVANLEQLPTLDELRRQFAKFLSTYHDEPQSGSGMFGLSPRECFEQHCTELRRLDDDTLDFLCCRLVGPRKIGRDGVLYNDIRYGHFDIEVWKLQGREVFLRIDPDQADFVWICDEHGRPLCMATARQITGATQEEVREAHRIRGRMRKIAEQYAPARDFLLETSAAQIMQRKAEHARRRAGQALADPAGARGQDRPSGPGRAGPPGQAQARRERPSTAG
jgi:hypothetical protein